MKNKNNLQFSQKKEGNDSISIIAQSNKDFENSLNDKFNIKS